MSDYFSNVSVKSQTVIPKEVRERLGLEPGDCIRYRVRGECIEIERAESPAREDPFATFTE